MTRTIPSSVPRAELHEALQPLCDLLGITPSHIYSATGLHLREDGIVFVIPAPVDQEEWDGPRPKSRLSRGYSPLAADVGADALELASLIVVKVIDSGLAES